MRKFQVRRGRFQGEHIIYDNVEEAKKHGIEPISPWYGVRQGEWAVADDGYILQCLHKYKLTNKTHKSGQFTEAFRFCNGTFYVYYGKKKTLIRNFYGAFTSGSKSGLGSHQILGRYLTPKKLMFAKLIAQGIDPSQAIKIAYGSKIGAHFYIKQLLNDKLVWEVIMASVQPFIKEVEKKVKVKTGSDLIDFIANQITDLVLAEKMSLKDRRENIKLLLTIFGKQLGIVEAGPKDRKQIEEAEFEIIKPPELGTNKSQ